MYFSTPQVLNTSKTKEIILDFGKKAANQRPVAIKGDPIEVAEDYKYLGTIIDSKLSWKSNTEAI